MAPLYALLYPNQSAGDKAVQHIRGLGQAGYLTAIDSAFTTSVTEALEPGGSAILLLADTSSPERLRQELGPLGGRFMSTDLSSERIAEVQLQFDQAFTL